MAPASSSSSDASSSSSSDEEEVLTRTTRSSPKKEDRKILTAKRKMKKRPTGSGCWTGTKKRRGRAGKKGGKCVPTQSWEGFSFAATFRENHQKPLYGVAFSPFIGYKNDEDPVFATVGSNRATIYKCPRGKNDLELLQCYEDDEVLTGHGKAINEMRTHPVYTEVLLSAGRDWRVKIWHVTLGQLLLMVGGASPHTDEVLSADFDISGKRVVTSSMDHYIKIWDLKDKLDKQIETIDQIRGSPTKQRLKKFSPLEVNFPQVITNDVHTNYVDCARFFVEDFLVTKSCEEQICIWKVGDERAATNSYHHTRPETNISSFRVLPLPDSDVWFMKFVVDPTFTFLASGDMKGKIKLWPVGKDFMKTDEAAPKVLQHRLMCRCVRQLDFSPRGEFLVGVCDDSTVWRWDRNPEVVELD